MRKALTVDLGADTHRVQEKANQQHYQILKKLYEVLSAAGWHDFQEIPAAIDLSATRPGNSERVIFEVKSLSASNELGQCRAALSQLVEYRFFYGADSDRLCLVIDRAIADRRRALLEGMGIAIVNVTASGRLEPIGQIGIELLATTKTKF